MNTGFIPGKPRLNSEYAACPALALETMTSGYSNWVNSNDNSQLSAAA
jgi:hypothetical protein